MRQFTAYGDWIRQRLGCRTQKIAIDAGFSCPNRDGKVGVGGCIFCDNRTFNPSYCDGRKSVTEQIEEGKKFFAAKYPEMKYLAYFQAFSNTYAPLPHLKSLYEEALAAKDVIGIIIGTRPDCLSPEIFDYLEELSHRTFLTLELGVESFCDSTLQRINRGHTAQCSIDAIKECSRRGIICCIHIILGLPGEDREESLRQMKMVADLPIDILKLHQLQVIKGTALAEEYARNPFKLYTVEEYAQLISDCLDILPSRIVLERFVSQSPPDLLIAPHWGLKNYEFTNLLKSKSTFYSNSKSRQVR